MAPLRPWSVGRGAWSVGHCPTILRTMIDRRQGQPVQHSRSLRRGGFPLGRGSWHRLVLVPALEVRWLVRHLPCASPWHTTSVWQEADSGASPAGRVAAPDELGLDFRRARGRSRTAAPASSTRESIFAPPRTQAARGASKLRRASPAARSGISVARLGLSVVPGNRSIQSKDQQRHVDLGDDLWTRVPHIGSQWANRGPGRSVVAVIDLVATT